jgi:hypothetical protein
MQNALPAHGKQKKERLFFRPVSEIRDNRYNVPPRYRRTQDPRVPSIISENERKKGERKK